ncbi:hypothetical protein C8T65DRAFT_704025 [Cerioporus squamosus]|nr:hypothetical protein C8T65DRAFT_704025 [Cerioporus squamosus]
MARVIHNSQGQSQPASSGPSASTLSSTDSALPTPQPQTEPPSTPPAHALGQAGDCLPQGAAAVLGVAILENPRLPDPQNLKQCSIIVDGGRNFLDWLYNNPNYNLDFLDPNMRDKFIVFAMIAKCHERAEIFSEGSWEDYDIIGDIIWVYCILLLT